MTSRGFSTILFIVIISLSTFHIGNNSLTVYESFETAQSRPCAYFRNEPQATSVNQHYKYREFAETELYRPRYLPVPYVVGGIQNGNNNIDDLRTLPIPNVDLSQLIRQQHMSHKLSRHQQNRLPSTILEGVTHITELRQTPFRRFPESSPANKISYEEKRRRWKAELNKRLRGHKVPTRPKDETLNGGDYGVGIVKNLQVLTNNDSDRYYITYSPHSRVYQVSRPQNSKNLTASQRTSTSAEHTEMKNNALQSIILPTDEIPESSYSYEMNDRRQEGDVNKVFTTAEPIIGTKLPTTVTSFVRLEEDENNSFKNDVSGSTPNGVIENESKNYLIAQSKPFVTTEAITVPTTTTLATIVVQEAKAFPRNVTFLQEIRVASERPPLIVENEFPIVKQILHLDDYYQEMEDEESSEATITPATTTIKAFSPTHLDFRKSEEATEKMDLSIIKPADILERSSHDRSSPAPQMPSSEMLDRFTQPSGVTTTPAMQSLDHRQDSFDEEEDDDDDDLFFWRPEPNSYNQRSF